MGPASLRVLSMEFCGACRRLRKCLLPQVMCPRLGFAERLGTIFS